MNKIWEKFFSNQNLENKKREISEEIEIKEIELKRERKNLKICIDLDMSWHENESNSEIEQMERELISLKRKLRKIEQSEQKSLIVQVTNYFKK